MSEEKVKVKVAKFRQMTDHLFRVANYDMQSCATPEELANWEPIARKVLADLKGVTCPRASEVDLGWYNRAIAMCEQHLADLPKLIYIVKQRHLNRLSAKNNSGQTLQ